MICDKTRFAAATIWLRTLKTFITTGAVDGQPVEPSLSHSGPGDRVGRRAGYYLPPYNIDAGQLMPWRIHHIPGKTRNHDLLLVEFGEYANNRQVTAFKYTGKITP